MGGGKQGGMQTAPAPMMQTMTTVGNDALNGPAPTLDVTDTINDDQENTARMGTRGLRIGRTPKKNKAKKQGSSKVGAAKGVK